MSEKTKEEILEHLLKNILEKRLTRLEKRNLEQSKDLKFEKDSYKKQELLLNKLCSIKIEPKKVNQVKNNNRERTARNRSRDITPNNLRTFHRRNNSNKKQTKQIRSMTPDVKVKKRGGFDKKEKVKSDLRTTKKVIKKNNNNIPSYMMGTASNANKLRRNDRNNINDKSKKKIRARTADVKKRNKVANKKVNKEKNDIENNLKLIDLKIEDIKEHVPIKDNDEEIKSEKNKEIIQPKIEEKKEEIKEEIKPEEIKPEEKEINKFDNIIEDKIIKTLISFLDKESLFNFCSCNKKLIKYLTDKLNDLLLTLELNNNINENSTIQNQITILKTKYPEQYNLEPPKLSLSRGTIKALELLNNEDYTKIFNNKELLPPLDEIIFVYRIFFQFLNNNEFKYIKDEKLFWIEASDFILNIINKCDEKLGDYFKNSIDNFDFSPKNIYEAKKLIKGKEDQLKPANFTKICATTGLIIFLVKDMLEYCGIILNFKKNTPSICLRYLEYIEDAQNKFKNYIKNINEWNANKEEKEINNEEN